MAIFRGALPADNFAIVANHWFRDPRLTGKAKGYMGYIATHDPGYRLTVEQLIAEMREGKDAVYAGLEELVKFDYLVRTQTTGEDGRFGDVDYHFGPAAFEQQYERAWRPGKTAGQTASGKSGSGRDQGERDESAGQTASGFSASGKPASGKSDAKKTKSLEDQGLEDQEETPPREDTDAAAAAEPGQAVTRGGEIPLEDETREELNAAVDQVVAARAGTPGWDVHRVRRAVRVCLETGDDPADVIAALDVAADDKATRAPGRLPHIVATLVREREAAAATPAAAGAAALDGPFRYLDNDRPRCPQHPGHPADNCGPCRIDARIAAAEAAEPAEPAAAPPGAGAAAARAAVAAARKAAARKAAVPRQSIPADPAPAAPAPEPATAAA